MGDTADPMDLQARVVDLEREVSGLQRLLHGQGRRPFSAEKLTALYWEACRRFGRLAEREVFLWNTIILALDVTQLLKLARAVRDPFPWKPFLVLLDYATHEGYVVDDSTEHLLEISQELLNLQGLWALRPADLMGSPLAIQKAVSSIS